MAGHQYRQGVVRACLPYSPHGVRIAYRLSDLLVGADLPVRDPVELLHDAAPEIRAVVVQVEIEIHPLAGEVLVHLLGGIPEDVRLPLIHRRQVVAREVQADDRTVAVLGDVHGPQKGEK